RLEGFAVATAAGGVEALDAIGRMPPSAVVLDVTMPDLDGVTVVRRLRAEGVDVPVCILSARDEVADRVAGLEAGADDYLVKPFAIAELTARLNALLRRRGTNGAGPHVVGDVVIDPRRHLATRSGRELDLTRREFELLETFARHPGLLLSGVEAGGGAAVDRDLRRRADLILRRSRPSPPGALDGGPPARPPGEVLLAGSGSFAQVSLRGQVVEQRGDVPGGAPVVPASDGLSTVHIAGSPWRVLAIAVDPGSDARLELFSSLDQVEARVANTRHLVVWLGLAALLVTALAAWGFTSFALRPLARLRAGAARVSSAEDLGT